MLLAAETTAQTGNGRIHHQEKSPAIAWAGGQMSRGTVADPAADAFARLWPEARATGLLDDSLSEDLAAAGAITPEITRRFLDLADYVVANGAAAILFTCSAFGAAIDAVKAAARVPVLKPNEAGIAEALEAGPRIVLLAVYGY